MKVYDCVQRSPEWHALRCGRVTGSCAPALLAVRKRGTGELAVRRDMRQRLVVERLTGQPVNELPYLPKDMQHGVDCEPEAFAAHDTLLAGCSPDGYVDDWTGAIELKCPSSATHLEYRTANVIPDEYYGQLVHTLWITGAQWVDFCSYDPRFPEPLRLFCQRLERSAVDLVAYELAVRLFLDEVEKDVQAVLAGSQAVA